MKQLIALLLCTMFLLGCSVQEQTPDPKPYVKEEVNLSNTQVATFAGGCFWCVEADFEKVEGVKEVISGYSGGEIENPTYKQVSSGQTKYIESVQVHYDPQVVTYEELVTYLFKHTNPTDAGGQFVDRGNQYVTAIFYTNEQEQQTALRVKDELEQYFDKPIVTQIRPFVTFYEAEEYHQDFYKKDPDRYYSYRSGSGRDQFIENMWENR